MKTKKKTRKRARNMSFDEQLKAVKMEGRVKGVVRVPVMTKKKAREFIVMISGLL